MRDRIELALTMEQLDLVARAFPRGIDAMRRDHAERFPGSGWPEEELAWQLQVAFTSVKEQARRDGFW